MGTHILPNSYSLIPIPYWLFPIPNFPYFLIALGHGILHSLSMLQVTLPFANVLRPGKASTKARGIGQSPRRGNTGE